MVDQAAPSTLSTTKDDCFDDAAGGLHVKQIGVPRESAADHDFKYICMADGAMGWPVRSYTSRPLY